MPRYAHPTLPFAGGLKAPLSLTSSHPQATAGSVVEEAPGAFPAIDRMLESDGLFAEQVKLHAATLKAAKAQPTLAPKA